MSAEHFTCPRCGETTSLIPTTEFMPPEYGKTCRPCFSELQGAIEAGQDSDRRLRKVKIFPPIP